MYILITYDVDTTDGKGQKRLRQVAKVCQNYGQRVQNSVFECDVTEAQLCMIKEQIRTIIDNDLDSIRFYFLSKTKEHRVDVLGTETAFDVTEVLII